MVTVFSRLKGFDVADAGSREGSRRQRVNHFAQDNLPLALPAVAAGWLLSFTLSMDDVVVSSFVTGPGYENTAAEDLLDG
nr:spermidine/putrescine ABC transporter membrane protein [Raoultella sp. NCTC 9187]